MNAAIVTTHVVLNTITATHVLIQATAHSTMNPYHGQVLPLDPAKQGDGTGEYVLVEGVSTKVFAYSIAAYIEAAATLEEASAEAIRLANLPAATLHVTATRVQLALEAPTGSALEAIAGDVNRAIRKPLSQVGTLVLKSEAFPDATMEVLNAYYLADADGGAVRLFVAPLPRKGQESHWHQLQPGDAITEHTPEMAVFQRQCRLGRRGTQ